jgi:hypothetical protein
MAKKIFISYRREDAPASAHILFNYLATKHGPNVFLDVDRVPYGKDFKDVIATAIGKSSVLIAVMGKNWLGSKSRNIIFPWIARTRVWSKSDPVRFELEEARRQNVQIFPVLVENARMPRQGQLPDSLHFLITLNTFTIAPGKDMGRHVEEFINVVENIQERTEPYKSIPRSDLYEKCRPILIQLVQLRRESNQWKLKSATIVRTKVAEILEQAPNDLVVPITKFWMGQRSDLTGNLSKPELIALIENTIVDQWIVKPDPRKPSRKR